MRHTTVKDLELLRAGVTVDGILGTITKVYERKEGNNSNGDWSFQSAQFTDEDGNSCKLKFKNHPAVSNSIVGRKVEILTVGDSKAKGVSIDEHEGKKSFLLFPTVEFNFIEGGRSAPQERREERTQQQAPPAREAPPATAQPRQNYSQRMTPEGKIPIHGATVGMALNQASRILTESVSAADRLKYFLSPQYLHDLYTVASGIVRVSQHMERGNLAPKEGTPTARTQSRREPVDADRPETYQDDDNLPGVEGPERTW
jgi:hypothetical protein